MKTKINTIIISNNNTRKEKIERFVRINTMFNIIDSFNSIIEAYHCLAQNSVEVIFTDEKNHNFYSLPQVDMSIKPLVISTIFNESDLLIEEISTIDLSVQSFLGGRFSEIMKRIIEGYEQQEANDFLEINKSLGKDMSEKNLQTVDAQPDNFIFIRTNYSFTKIFFDDIIYIKAMENFVQIVTTNDTYTTLVSLKNMLSKLPNNIFKQVHRSYIINFNKIQSLEKNTLKIDKHDIPIGAAFKEKILEILIQKRVVKR